VARTGAATRRRRTAWRRPRRTRGAPPARDAPRPPRFFAVAWGGTWPGRPPIALTIADSDPSGGAGIQAELKTFHRHGVYGQTVLRLLTAQDTRGVQGVFVQPVDVVRAQLHSVADELEARPPVPWSSIRCWSASTATHSPAAAAAARHRGDAEPLRSRSAHRHRGHRPDVGAGGGAPAAGPGTARRSCCCARCQDSPSAASCGGLLGRGLGDVLRTYGIEVRVCPQGSGVRRVLAAIHDPAAIARVLLAMGLPSAAPEQAGCRAPPAGGGLDDASEGAAE
jgi:hypothetical protein